MNAPLWAALVVSIVIIAGTAAYAYVKRDKR